ncbi:TPA: hypothetical protein I3803_004661 [Enterobacter cloacae]|nr:hypothetical protein [Enterobacter cloacae]
MKPTNREPIYKLGDEIKKAESSYFAVHKAKQRIDVHNKNNVYYLAKGNLTAYSYGGEVLIFNIFAPEIVCLEKLESLMIFNHFRCITDCEIHVVSATEMRAILDSRSLWSDAYAIICRYLNGYYNRENKLNQRSARESIIEYLKYIWNLPEAQRQSTSIYSFILERTHISRSLIYKVVSELEKEKTIAVSRGVLTQCRLN